ncbi:winged helix-turn-helix domain-containing protein [Micromonospora sp. RTP1Z1]|uniref:winged helix-turn-helix domain-containing protein n=1 Tax=Micromonospora sp. RTP1Z1 TaxID=2994043 RepID=UPI0029C7AC72|nr:winged helix-turn-helix domain-containing protein [Micromonospora sp. RTP1Z1]
MPIPMGYRRIADDLRARIAAGEYPPGERLPTYKELAEMYSAGVSTIQKAVLLLQSEGAVVGVQGAGLYVPEDWKP